jgi:hypothetical protein
MELQKKKDGNARYSLEGALARKGSKRAEYTVLNVIPPVRKRLGTFRSGSKRTVRIVDTAKFSTTEIQSPTSR